MKKSDVFARGKNTYLRHVYLSGVFGAKCVVSDGTFAEEALMFVIQLSSTTKGTSTYASIFFVNSY